MTLVRRTVTALMMAGFFVAGSVRAASTSAVESWAEIVDQSTPAEFLQRVGTDPNARDARGITPLLAASWRGNVEMVRGLLQAGADPNLKEPSGPGTYLPQTAKLNMLTLGGSPLRIALIGRHHEVAWLLINAGADLLAEDKGGYNLLFTVCDGEIARRLVAAGLDPRKTTSKRGAYDFIGTPFPMGNAVRCPDPGVARVFIAGGVDVNQRIADGTTALFMAARSNAPLDMIRLLLDAGADPNAVDRFNRYPPLLEAARMHESPEVLQYLIERGADPCFKTERGATAVSLIWKGPAEAKREVLQRAREAAKCQ